MAEYSGRERAVLIAFGALGLIVLNTLFVVGFMIRPENLVEAFTNPIALVFIAESFCLLGIFSYLMQKWGVLRLKWYWFVLLALSGSMLFALPVVLLWKRRAPIE